MSNNLTIGWALVADEASAAFPEPEAYTPPKNATGYLSCPAVRAYFNNTFVVRSPFSLQLRAEETEEDIKIKPVYPFTSITEAMLSKFLSIEPINTWRGSQLPILQVISPYIFVADQPVTIDQTQPLVTKTSKLNWRVIPGTFNIYDWQRPVNWAIEWDTTCGDLIIRQGEPIYMIKFTAITQESVNKTNLVETKISETLSERIKSTKNVASIRRGTTTLMAESGKSRDSIDLINPK